jgi:sugar lactone lactonase YvrE
MSIPSTEARVLIAMDREEDRFLPEGPRSVVVEGRVALVWVNIQTAADSTRGALHLRFWDNGERRVLPQPARPGFVLPTDQPGMVVVGREKEIGLLDLGTGAWSAWAAIPDDNPRTIINDGEIVPGGRAIVFGTKDVRFADPIAQLYSMTLDDRKVWILADKQTCSNGKFFERTDQGLYLFDIDTPKRNVIQYFLEFATNEVNGVRHRIACPDVILDLSDIDGFPDGMIACGDGSAIIAFYNPHRSGPGSAIRFDLGTGMAIEEWTTPDSPRVTCPLLINRDGNVQLVLTTADEGMPAELRSQCPNAGNLFIAETTLKANFPAQFLRL